MAGTIPRPARARAMNIADRLREVAAIQLLIVPKELVLPREVVVDSTNTFSGHQVPCMHTFYPPAKQEDIELATSQLRQSFPQELKAFYRVTNGAELFQIHYAIEDFDDYWIPKYKILTCNQLAITNLELLDTYRSYIEDAQSYSGDIALDYVAFCDIGDGNFLAIKMEEEDRGIIFYLDHDYAYYPYRDIEPEGAYTYIANSLEEWLGLLIQSSGRDGMGDKFVRL